MASQYDQWASRPDSGGYEEDYGEDYGGGYEEDYGDSLGDNGGWDVKQQQDYHGHDYDGADPAEVVENEGYYRDNIGGEGAYGDADWYGEEVPPGRGAALGASLKSVWTRTSNRVRAAWASGDSGAEDVAANSPDEVRTADAPGGITAAEYLGDVSERNRAWSMGVGPGTSIGRYLAVSMVFIIIISAAVGIGVSNRNGKNVEQTSNQPPNSVTPRAPTPDPTPRPSLKPTAAPTGGPANMPTSTPRGCPPGLVLHRISLEAQDDVSSSPSIWTTSAGEQVRYLWFNLRDAEWSDLVYQNYFRSPTIVDYACLNVNDAPQQVTAQSGCYEVKVGWYIEGTGVAPVTEGGVRWQIEKWEGSVADREVGVGIVPYSQDRVTSCTVQTLTGNGFFQCLPNCAKEFPLTMKGGG